jgi:hypothetical protein
MPPSRTDQPETSFLPLLDAVFCLDCEVISNSQGEECPVCKGRSLVNLARMLGGSLFAHRAQQSHERAGTLFDITITVELQKMDAEDLTAMLEKISTVIAPQLARDRATFHINVKPTTDRRNLQRSLSFPEREAA